MQGWLKGESRHIYSSKELPPTSSMPAVKPSACSACLQVSLGTAPVRSLVLDVRHTW